MSEGYDQAEQMVLSSLNRVYYLDLTSFCQICRLHLFSGAIGSCFVSDKRVEGRVYLPKGGQLNGGTVSQLFIPRGLTNHSWHLHPEKRTHQLSRNL